MEWLDPAVNGYNLISSCKCKIHCQSGWIWYSHELWEPPRSYDFSSWCGWFSFGNSNRLIIVFQRLLFRCGLTMWPAQNSLCVSGWSWTCNCSPVSVSPTCRDCRSAPPWSATFALHQDQQWQALCDRIIRCLHISLKKFPWKDFGHLKLLFSSLRVAFFFFTFYFTLWRLKFLKFMMKFNLLFLFLVNSDLV